MQATALTIAQSCFLCVAYVVCTSLAFIRVLQRSRRPACPFTQGIQAVQRRWKVPGGFLCSRSYLSQDQTISAYLRPATFRSKAQSNHCSSLAGIQPNTPNGNLPANKHLDIPSTVPLLALVSDAHRHPGASPHSRTIHILPLSYVPNKG